MSPAPPVMTLKGMALIGGKALRGKVVVVTGASSGVGRAIAHGFAKEGAKLALLARNEPALENAASEVRALGGEALVVPTDVSIASEVDAALEKVLERFGDLDIWVNNAMVTALAPAVEMTAVEFERITDVNYLGAVYGTVAALRHLRKKDEGLVLQVGSALVYRSIPLQSAYCATKAAMRGFTDSVRCELLHEKSKVRISMLDLPAVNTPQFDVGRNHMHRAMRPVGRIFQPEVIAKAAIYATKHQVPELIIGGTTLQARLGQKFIPRLLDRYLAKTAWEGQLTDEPLDERRPDNLMKPVPFDPGTHGRFDADAKAFSLELWLRMHRAKLVAGLSLLGGALWLGQRRRLA